MKDVFIEESFEKIYKNIEGKVYQLYKYCIDNKYC